MASIPIEKEIKSVTRAGYYPNKKSISIKIVADRKSQRVLGAQIVGGEGVKGRIDLVAVALLMRATIDDLVNYDACYVPPSFTCVGTNKYCSLADSKVVSVTYNLCL
jgi:pyruvate/2-oxoglutarate dehydrogenase complex dihydrolipoamide dehydrogenase (E3) component